jgi:hypothetical protein
MQFHPLAYMVKLKIEMSMADLIGRIARQGQGQAGANQPYYRTYDNSTSHGGAGLDRTRAKTEITATQKDIELTTTARNNSDSDLVGEAANGRQDGIYTTREIHIEFDDAESAESSIHKSKPERNNI